MSGVFWWVLSGGINSVVNAFLLVWFRGCCDFWCLCVAYIGWLLCWILALVVVLLGDFGLCYLF